MANLIQIISTFTLMHAQFSTELPIIISRKLYPEDSKKNLSKKTEFPRTIRKRAKLRIIRPIKTGTHKSASNIIRR